MYKVNNDDFYSWVIKAFYLVVIGMVFLIALTIIFKFDLRGVESNVIYSIQLTLKNNGLLFASPESPPFNITQYSPLYYIFSDGVISLLSIDCENYFAIRVITRIMSLVLLILSLCVIKDILQNFIGLNKSTSQIIVLFYLVISFPWFNISRPDVLILLFFALSIRCVLLFHKNEKNLNAAILLGVFLALGILSKLTMVFYFIAFGIYMLIAKKWRLALFTAISFVLSLVIMLIIIQLLGYDLTYLYENIIKGVDNGISIHEAWKKAYKNYFAYFGLFSFVFILFSLVYLKSWKFLKTNFNLLFLITISYSITIFSFFTALKVGSAINYFNELLLCLILFIISFLESYHIIKKKLYLISIMLFGISIAINHAFRYAPALLTNLVHPIRSNERSERSGEITDVIEFLSLNLDDDYYFSQNREIKLSHPNKCILFPTDIHNTTYKRDVFDYSIMEEWAKENLRFIIVKANSIELYGMNIKEYYSLKMRTKHYDLYELTSYNKK